MNDVTVGTCSLCGGAVTVPGVWMGVVPPTPTCQNCGAVAMPNHGPIIPMQPSRTTTGTAAIVTTDMIVVA